MEKEYADRVQDYLKQLKDEMKAKIESKTTVIRDQYKIKLNQEIEKLKAEWAQEHLKTNEQHNAQISQVLKEVEVLKEQSRSQPKAESNEPGDKISGLKATAFNFMPGMVNTRRGGAANIHDDTILWSKNDDTPPIPPRKQDEKHIHFTSTPCHPVHSNLFDSDDENPIIGHSGNPFISNPGNPFVQQLVCSQIPAQTTVDTDATTIIGNTMSTVASEFKKMREPKLAKLNGGVTSRASLFFNSWVKDIRAVILEWSMSNAESLQLVKDYTEGKLRQQVEFYIVSTPDPTFEGLINNLRTSFQSGEDEATIKGEFYSRKQYSKESVDDFADVLQLLALQVLNVDPSFQMFMNKSLCQQLANGLKDPGHGTSARSILNQQPDIQFASFRSDLANILGCRIRTAGAKGTLCNAAMAPESPETPIPAKHCKTEEESTIAAQLSMCIKDNQELHKKLDAFDPNKIMEIVTKVVAGGYQKSFQKPNTYQKSTNPFVPSQQKPQASQNINPFGKPYLGPPREPQVTPGADGSLNPALSCKYCKDTGHNVSNCQSKKERGSQSCRCLSTAKCCQKGKLDRLGSRDRDSGLLKIYDPKQFLSKRVYNESELDVLRTMVTCKTLTKAERYNIMEQAVALCPEITMIIKGQKVWALLDMRSQVTLMNKSYYLQNIQHLLLTVDKDHLNAHKLFNLKGVEDGCVPLTKYYSVDIQVGGRLVHDTGILIKKDNIPLTNSKGRSTRAPAILGCNLIRKGMEEFIRDHGETCLELFECPAGVDPLYFSTLCVYFYAERQKVIDQAKEKVKRDISINSMGKKLLSPSNKQ